MIIYGVFLKNKIQKNTKSCDLVTEKTYILSIIELMLNLKERREMAVLNITKDNFEKEVLQSTQPVLIDFWADWCGPCKMIGPVVEEIARETDNAKICKVNVDEQPELAAQFNVMSIPTLVVIKDGKVVNTAVGVRPKVELMAMINV